MPRISGILRDDSGLAAVEFALIATFLSFLLFAGFDFGRYVVASQRVEAAAYSIAQMLSQTAPSASAVESGTARSPTPNCSGITTAP